MGPLSIFFCLLGAVSGVDWQRSPFLAHWEPRTPIGWERNLMRVNRDGSYTGQWLWDHVILTAFYVNQKNIMYGEGMEGKDFTDLLGILRNDAASMNYAIGNLKRTYGSPPKGQILASFAIPYIEKKNRIVTIGQNNYDLSLLAGRKALASWYVQEVYNTRTSGTLDNVLIHGIYYHKEDAIDANDDIPLIQHINSEVHRLGMKSVWVPYYNAPHNWEGKSLLNFDVLVIQPGLAFQSSIDGGSVKEDRLYAIGQKSVRSNQCFEYENRGAGEADLDYANAHEYLAVAQATGASAYPQVFFFIENFMDAVVERADKGYRWDTYTDLANYLQGQTIGNFEVQIAYSIDNFQDTASPLIKSLTWPVTLDRVNSIRLDFTDAYGYWRGKVVVRVGARFSSYAQRTGPDILDTTYSSVYVPVSNGIITSGMSISIEIHRETASDPYPTIWRVVAANKENPYVSNPLHQELSSSSSTVSQGPYPDSVPSHVDWARGLLTDNNIGAGNSWYDNRALVVGWYTIPEGEISISIDLQVQAFGIKEVRVYSFFDGSSAVREFSKLTATLRVDCVPRKQGTLELGCVPTASSLQATYNKPDPSVSSRVVYSLPFNPVGINGPVARYVTLTGIPLSWGFIDEIQVIDLNGVVVSARKPYKVTPIPGNLHSDYEYPDRDGTLTDGAVFWTYKYDGGRGIVGLHPKYSNNFVQTIWDTGKFIGCARFWITQPNQDWGIVWPSDVQIQIRDLARNWGLPIAGTVDQYSAPTPSVVLCFSSTVAATGVKATFNNLAGWVMVTEITVE